MRGWLVAAGLGLLLLVTGCGGGDDDLDTPRPVDPDGAATTGGELGYQPPECPFDAAGISALLGVELTEQGGCSFSDGIALVALTQSSHEAGLSTYDYQRELAEQTYDQVADLGLGEMSYWSVKDIGAEAAVVTSSGSYTLTMSSFSMDPAGYEQALRALLDVAMS